MNWQDAPYVYVIRPACPHCGATGYTIVRSSREPDGSVSRRCVCRSCSRRFFLVLETPVSGVGTLTARYVAHDD